MRCCRVVIPATMLLCTRGKGVIITSDPTEQFLVSLYFPRVGVNMNSSLGAVVKPVHTAVPRIFRSRGCRVTKKERKKETKNV